MSEYKRLTEKTRDCFQYDLKNFNHKIDEFNDYDAFFAYSMAVKRLGELEEKIENGTLIFIDEPFYSECNAGWAVFQRTNDNVITCHMTEQQAKDYKKFRKIDE